MNKSIKEMLKEGMNPDELRAILEKEIAEVEAEKNDSVSTIRNDLALSLIRYAKAMGLNLDITEAEIAALLKEVEPEVKKYAKIFQILLESEIEKEDKKENEGYKPYTLTKFNKSEDELDKLMRKLIGDIVK